MPVAERELGTREITGSRHNPRILEYFRVAGSPKIRDDETAWCSAFVCAILHWSGFKNPKNLWARSFANYGIPLDKPEYGCIVVLKRGPVYGHVGFFVRMNAADTHILVRGGNQDNTVSDAWFPVADVIAYRWPDEAYPEPDTEPEVGAGQLADPVADLSRPPSPPAETPELVAARLRAHGSRTMQNADSAEAKAKGLASLSIAGLVASVMSAFTDLYAQLSPLVPLLGASALAALALLFAVYIIHNQRAVRAARIEDDLNGLHVGRKGAVSRVVDPDVPVV